MAGQPTRPAGICPDSPSPAAPLRCKPEGVRPGVGQPYSGSGHPPRSSVDYCKRVSSCPRGRVRSCLWSLGLQPQSLNMVRKDLYKEKASCFISFTDEVPEDMVTQYLGFLDGAVFDGRQLECIVAGPPKCPS